MTAISIIICTQNRAEDLRQTLESLGTVCVPEAMPTEVIVVDNNSTDGTAALIKACRLPNMTVRYLHEPRRGKSHGLNRAMAQAAGEVFLFSDDDLRFPKDWVTGMCKPILAGDADALVGGIRMAPALERPWMEQEHHLLLASNSWWQPSTEPSLVGANMAVSRRVLAQVPGFDPEIGAGTLGAYEDYLFSQQITRAGFRLQTALPVWVEHHFQPDRLTAERMARAAEAMGRSWAYVAHHWKHEPAPYPWLSWVRAVLRWQFYHARHFLQTRGRTADYLPGWEVQQRQDVAFAAQMLHEVKRPRRYAQFGLSPLTPGGEGK